MSWQSRNQLGIEGTVVDGDLGVGELLFFKRSPRSHERLWEQAIDKPPRLPFPRCGPVSAPPDDRLVAPW